MAAGPDIDALTTQSRSHTAAARQHKIAGARVVDKGLLPRGMTPAQHVEAARQLAHPFAEDAALKMDAEFATETMARLGPNASVWGSRIMQMGRSSSRQSSGPGMGDRHDQGDPGARHLAHGHS
eukprot:15860181-Heterocapsa_arctica.AAC.1